VADAALYLVLPKLIAVLTVPGLIRGQQDRADAAAGPFLPGSGTFGSSEPKPGASPRQAAESLPRSKVITMRPPSWQGGAAMIFGTRRDRNAPAYASPPGAPVTQGASWPSSRRFGEIQENAGVVLAGSLPCPGRVAPCLQLPRHSWSLNSARRHLTTS